MAIEPSALGRPRAEDDEPFELGEEEVGPEGGIEEPALEPPEEGSWLDAEPDSDVEVPGVDDEDAPSALDDAPADVDDDPLEVGDEARWTEGSEADESMEHAPIDAPDDDDRAADDGAEGLEGDQVEPGFGEGDVTPGSDDTDDELAMGALEALDEGEGATVAEGVVAIGSHEGEGVEVWPDRARVGRHEIPLTPPAAGALVLDDERIFVWSEGGAARVVRVDEPGARRGVDESGLDGSGLDGSVLEGVRLAAADGRGGVLVANEAGAVLPLVRREGSLVRGPVRVSLEGLRSLAVVGSTTFLVAGERLYALGVEGALEPVQAAGTPLVVAADARGRLLVALGRSEGVEIERWAPERGGKRERLGRLQVRPDDVRGLASPDRGIWVLVGTRRVTLLGDGPVEAG